MLKAGCPWRKRGLVEGRKTNLVISARLAEATGGEARYIKTKSVDDQFLKQLVINYLRQWGRATRKDIDDVLREKLQSGLTDQEKTNRITYLITSMHRAKAICNRGSRTKPEWVLFEDAEEVQKEKESVQKEDLR